MLSGYAEMLKHGLLESQEELDKLLGYSVVYPLFDSTRLLSLIEASVAVKQRVVEADFSEEGYRKVLNLGHTFGHAFEALVPRKGRPCCFLRVARASTFSKATKTVDASLRTLLKE